MSKFSVVASALLFTAASGLGYAEVPLGEPGYVSGRATHGPESENAGPTPENWGGDDFITVNYAAIGFSPLNDGQWSHFSTGWSYKGAGGNTGTCIDVHMPSGALAYGITTWTNDTDAAANIQYVYRDVDLVTNTSTTHLDFTTAGTPGIQRVYRAFAAPITINNDRHAHSLCTFHGAIGTTLQNAGATFWYQLQVSPAPGVASFPNDVPTTHPLFRFVEALAASGVSGGCGAGSFCPDAPLTRGQMAVFLSVALGMHFPN
jgi:hypothetical protein